MKTLEDAAAVAAYLFERLFPDPCEAIGLFGSIARNGVGNDIDLAIFVTHSYTARQSLRTGEQMLNDIANPTKEDKHRVRQHAARETLNIERLAPENICEESVDVLLYPFYYDIEAAIDNLQTSAKSHALEANVVRDLQLFVPRDRRFVPWSEIIDSMSC